MAVMNSSTGTLLVFAAPLTAIKGHHERPPDEGISDARRCRLTQKPMP